MPSSPAEFRNVLFCPMSSRGTLAAIRRVVAVIDHGAELAMVGVVPEPSRFDALVHGPSHVSQVLEAGQKAWNRRLARCRGAVDRAGWVGRVSSHVDTGDPASALVTRAIAGGHDLVAVAVDGEADDVMLRRLLRKSPCPVWVIRPSRAPRPRIVAAIDADPEQAELNQSIMDVASRLAGPSGELHVVNAWQLLGEATMRSSAFIHVDGDEIDRRREAVRTAHDRAVDSAVATRGSEAERWVVHVVEGDANEVVAELTRRRHATTLVIGTVARSGLSGLVMGNTAERVIDAVRCSLLTVQPPG